MVLFCQSLNRPDHPGIRGLLNDSLDYVQQHPNQEGLWVCLVERCHKTHPPAIMLQSKMGVSPIGSLPFKYSNFPLNHDCGT